MESTPQLLKDIRDNGIPLKGTITATSTENLALVGGVAVSVSTGAPSSGSQRVAVAADADNAPSTSNPALVGGKAVTGSSYAPAYTVGDAAIVPIDKDSGGVLCHTRTLTTSDAITATPVASSLANSTAYVASLVVKASAGRLFSVNGYNSKGSTQFIQVHNATSLPANTAVPIATITVPTVSNFSIDFGPLGIPLSTGIVLGNSSTGPTLTTGSADVYFTASYV